MILTKTIKAYAKINLYLDVGEKQPGGYHHIESLMQQVSLFDYVTVVRDTESTIRSVKICCNDKAVPANGENIAARCASAFLEKYHLDSEITIYIDKRIPIAGGLAGGSANGAAALMILNFLFDINASLDDLCKLGAAVGADIPFCLVGGTCIATGIGDVLTSVRLPSLPYHVLICNAGDGVSTAAAYAKVDEVKDETIRSIDDVLTPLRNGEIPLKLYNSFEQVVLPENDAASQIKNDLMANGAASALMSGSGPSVFGLFSDSKIRDAAKLYFDSRGIRAIACEPITKK